MEIFQNFPFDIRKEPINITQWFNWPWSHYNFSPEIKLDLSYSIDFALPINTEILAVKKGIVRVTRDISCQFYEGLDVNKGMSYGMHCNFIWVSDIENNSKSVQYIHLAQNSIKVKVGEIVNPWDVLAKTWKSWWVWPIPHLHIHYWYFVLFKGLITMPFIFKNYWESLEHTK
jgi:murein DD-endopeptidase MepM/ murein hydrolase activator NlpD